MKGAVGCTAAQARQLQRWAKQNLATVDEGADVVWVSNPSSKTSLKTPVCDVITCCDDDSEQTNRAVRSVLAQQGAEAIIHLIDNGGSGKDLLFRYCDRRNVLTHSQPVRLGLFEALHELVPHLRSEYVAIQDARTTSHSDRLSYSVAMLTEYGGDLLASALQCPNEKILPQKPEDNYQAYVPSPTLVFRRASLVDMGGIANRREDEDIELVYRASQEKRKILLSRRTMVSCPTKWSPSPAGPAPVYRPKEGSLRHHAKGFPEETVACDVVLPFHGHLDYLQEAMQSLLDQKGSDLVIHLLDDASPEDTEPVLRYWGTHPRVRTYRNERNLGQFVSFNNVFPYLETSFVAVQDADDISLPQRIHRAGNALRLADADIFGARLREFDGKWAKPERDITQRQRDRMQAGGRYLQSRYPGEELGHFLLNATAVIRASAFETLGGFTDFGELYRNRCAVDTEFYLRACYGGLRFAISRDVLVRYRCHADSATRNAQTGSGSPARAWSEAECRRRAGIFQRGRCDPRAFGGLQNWWGLTRRLN
jgi:GT2 family glycosyltransferase